jgi:hypothetical protein
MRPRLVGESWHKHSNTGMANVRAFAMRARGVREDIAMVADRSGRRCRQDWPA